MDSTRQQAIDYLTGSLSSEDRDAFESNLVNNESTRKLVAELSDDWSTLALLSRPSSPDPDLRSRTLLLTQEPPDLDPFLGCDGVERLRQNYSKPTERYLGGDGTVGTSEVKDISLKDGIFRTYEHLLSLLPLVSGDSSAAFGDFSDLQKFVCDNLILGNELVKWTDPLRPAEDLSLIHI